jgi:RNA polymerase sigma-70 factor (ECF subfamily)
MTSIGTMTKPSRQPSIADTSRGVGSIGDPNAALVDRLRRRESGGAEALVAVFGDRVYRLAIRITRSKADAEEVVRDALWTAMNKIDTFRDGSAFGSWIYRIAANAAYQKLRGCQVERNALAWDDLAASFDDAGRYVEPGVGWSSKLNDPVLRAELRAVLSATVNELPVDYRAAFVLRDVEGLSNMEVAQALEVNPITVKARVRRARLYLRARLSEYLSATPERLWPTARTRKDPGHD